MFNIFSKTGLMAFLFTLPVLLFSLSIHEFSHAIVAYKLGDKSQKALGRLSLDPFKHVDPFGFICIALFGFGWGKPVLVDDTNFKNRAKGNMLVSLAGPLSNLIMAVVFTLILKVLLMFNLVNFNYNSAITISSIFGQMILLAIEFNIVFGVFNLLPLPLFDGGNILKYFLPKKFEGVMIFLERYSFVIIILLLVTSLGSMIISPIVNFIYSILMSIL